VSQQELRRPNITEKLVITSLLYCIIVAIIVIIVIIVIVVIVVMMLGDSRICRAPCTSAACYCW